MNFCSASATLPPAFTAAFVVIDVDQFHVAGILVSLDLARHAQRDRRGGVLMLGIR